MIGYYLDLAWRSLRRNVSLTMLMILAVGFGVGASMTMVTVLHVLAKDPIPQKSNVLHYVQLDPRPLRGYTPGEEPLEQTTRQDAETLVREHRADHQAMMTGGDATLVPARANLDPFHVDARWTTNEFFAMFDVPFIKGGAWSAQEDANHARVAVISKQLAEKLFGSTDVVGFPVRVETTEMRVVGVLDDWRPIPHFYDLATDPYGQGEQLYVPWTTSRDLDLDRSGNMNCWDSKHDDPTVLGAPCEWIQLWVELDSDAKEIAYHDFLANYWTDQVRAGHYERPVNIRLRNVTDYLDYNKVIPDDAKLGTYVALGFLVVCLINTIGLLLTKFLRRSAEIGVRRALGASKVSIFIQLLIEAGVIGLAGGLLGLVLAGLGLLAIRHQMTTYADLAHLDMPMLVATFALAIISSLLAGLLPAWRGCQVAPALQLKSH
ncbi:MAG TPA: ABC transporter permease [Kofleriaceae bacterium]|nr:ABC transporter permease [Kofleriaceae bacterium]